MKKQWNRFLDTLSFMTTIRVRAGGFDEEFHRATLFFPSVGLVLGVLYQLIWQISSIFFGGFVSAVFVIAASVFLTGGLHLDGLGDTFDGVYSYRSKDRILEIMKDSRVGTNALLAVLIVILLKVGVLFQLAEWKYPFILCMPVVGRSVSLLSCFVGVPAKVDGSGNTFIGQVEKRDFWGGIFSSLFYITVVSFLFGDKVFFVMNMAAIAAVFLFVQVYIRDIRKRIGGLTGDVLGALCELSETVYLLCICAEVALQCVYI